MALSVEQCSSIACNTLQKNIKKLINKEFPGATEDEVFSHTQAELVKFEINGQIFKYDYMRNQLGGYRWFFLCDKCNKKANKLFLPPKEAVGYEHQYLCKRCHKLKNESVLKANSKLYKSVLRPLKKLREIEQKLEIGHLRPEKTKELLDEYDAIEKEMKSTPEYRLYVFKRKRGLKI